MTDLSGTVLPVPNRDGNISFVTNDVFVVDVTLSGGSSSIDALGITVGTPLFFLNPIGAGAFDDGGLQAPTSVTADNLINFAGLFDFSGGTLDAGETTVRLFVTYSPLGDIAAGQTVSFMISSGTDFTVQGIVVPEPAGLLILGGVLLAAARWASRRSA